MKILLLRHAIAEDREEFRIRTRKQDDFRPLTEKGIARWKKGAQGLIKLGLKPDEIWSSPLTRTQQTAEILAVHCDAEIQYKKFLSPESSVKKLLSKIQYKKSQTLVICGHEHHLSEFLEMLFPRLYSAKTQKLKKGGAALVNLNENGIFALVKIYKAQDFRVYGEISAACEKQSTKRKDPFNL